MSGKLKLKIKKGDMVEIIAGKDKGERGLVIRVIAERRQVLLEGLTKDDEGKAIPLNAVTKHKKPERIGEQGEKMRIPSPIDVSNVMLVDPHEDKPTRVGRRIEDGEVVRYAKRSDATLEN